MNNREYILLHKLIAGVFLLLFVFVHFIKLTHAHDNVNISQALSKHQHTAAAQNDCAICDYHFTKDAVPETTFVVSQDEPTLVELYTDYLSQRLTSIGLTSSGRGPPALI